jgi:hypothetical protein
MIEKNNKKRNQNVDIKLSACDTLLEYPSSDALKFERLESQIILKVFGRNKIKGPNKINSI